MSALGRLIETFFLLNSVSGKKKMLFLNVFIRLLIGWREERCITWDKHTCMPDIPLEWPCVITSSLIQNLMHTPQTHTHTNTHTHTHTQSASWSHLPVYSDQSCLFRVCRWPSYFSAAAVTLALHDSKDTLSSARNTHTHTHTHTPLQQHIQKHTYAAGTELWRN